MRRVLDSFGGRRRVRGGPFSPPSPSLCSLRCYASTQRSGWKSGLMGDSASWPVSRKLSWQERVLKLWMTPKENER